MRTLAPTLTITERALELSQNSYLSDSQRVELSAIKEALKLYPPEAHSLYAELGALHVKTTIRKAPEDVARYKALKWAVKEFTHNAPLALLATEIATAVELKQDLGDSDPRVGEYQRMRAVYLRQHGTRRDTFDA